MKKTHNNKSFSRSDRIAPSVQRHVAQILRDNYAEDPLLSRVSLVGAESHGGLQFVKLFWQGGSTDAQKKLDSIKNAIRFELAQRMDQKYVPDIKFVYDDTLEKSERIEKLLEGING